MEQYLYPGLTKFPHVKRPRNRTNDQAATRPGTAVALSQGLHQGLQQGLYQGLFQGVQARNHDVTAAPKEILVPQVLADLSLPREAETAPPETKVRKVGLLSGESVTHTFCPEQGLIPHPREQGRMLVLTNQRVIAFGDRDGIKETVLMPVEEVKAVAVIAGLRSKFMLFQGGLIVIAGVIIYVLLAYWLTGRIDGPTIPVIRMDLVAFLVFLAILSSVGIMAQFYFSRPDGEVTFQGDGVKLAFPFRGEIAEDHIYQVVNATFAARQSIRGSMGAGYPEVGAK